MLHGRHVFSRVCQSIGLLVCQQDYTKTTEWISTKLGWRMGLGPEQTLLTYVADPDKGTYPGISFWLSSMSQDSHKKHDAKQNNISVLYHHTGFWRKDVNINVLPWQRTCNCKVFIMISSLTVYWNKKLRTYTHLQQRHCFLLCVLYLQSALKEPRHNRVGRHDI